MNRQLVKNDPYQGYTPAERRHAKAGERELARMLRKPTPPPPKLIDLSVVSSMLGDVSQQTVWRRANSGHFPPPTKGLQPRPGETYDKWRTRPRKWLRSLAMAAASGLFDDRLPLEPFEWAELALEYQEGYRP